MAKGHPNIRSPMRPNIQISHQLNGRVRDYAARNDLTAEEAYQSIIELGIEEAEQQED